MPSPALRRMLRWPPDKLKGYIDNLELERQRLNAKLQQTKQPLQSTDPRIALEQRLGKLIDKAKELLAAKRLI